MLKARTLLILGIWTAVLPYLGFPYKIKNILFVLTGLALIYVSFVVYKETRKNSKEENEKNFENFRENRGFVVENQQ